MGSHIIEVPFDPSIGLPVFEGVADEVIDFVSRFVHDGFSKQEGLRVARSIYTMKQYDLGRFHVGICSVDLVNSRAVFSVACQPSLHVFRQGNEASDRLGDLVAHVFRHQSKKCLIAKT